jgi:hypothetical protein
VIVKINLAAFLKIKTIFSFLSCRNLGRTPVSFHFWDLYSLGDLLMMVLRCWGGHLSGILLLIILCLRRYLDARGYTILKKSSSLYLLIGLLLRN